MARGYLCWLSGQRGFDAVGHPGVSAEEAAEGVDLRDSPFGGGGEVGLDDREVGESFQGAPAAAGGPLLHLDRPDVALGLVISVIRNSE